MRRPIIAGNWKMYKNVNEAVELTNEIKRAVFNVNNVDIVIAPPFVNLSEVGDMLLETNIRLSAQNCYWEQEGAFTGEISVPMLKSVGCQYVIIGHSERRKYFGETDCTVNKKVAAVIENELIPIMCVGETLEEREAEKTLEVVKTQVTEGLAGFDEAYLKTLVIAYEPVWAIGTGKTATPGQAQEVHAVIRNLIKDLYSENLSSEIRILYGGSVNPGNIENLMNETDIDGGLIGGASLKSEGFIDIIKKTSNLCTKKGIEE
ncbi:MAG: triose-phosphate isomerase [Candidatus Omnitrophica bacterium]|nr:triose-phosphate isomerase [Candidatus Omnitrophota bacterium]MBU1894634.1 triose-phosphate isomerase [Candidatus Omnitrophota bacterium]